MNLRYLLFITAIFWGLQTDLLLWAIPMGLVLEARFFTDRRWTLDKQDFYRVADLTTVGLLGLIVFLLVNAREYHFITALIQWLPIAFFPLVTVLAFSTTERMPLDVLFHSLRRQRTPVTQSWDLDYLFFGLCLVGSGMGKARLDYYLPVVAGLLLFALFRLRSPRYPLRTWLGLAGLLLALTFASQYGLRQAHLGLKAWTQAWIEQLLQQRNDPLRAKTALGSVGKLKLSDAILFRLQMPDGVQPPALLQEASYDLPTGNDWMSLTPELTKVPHRGDFSWSIEEQPDASGSLRGIDSSAATVITTRVYREFEESTTLLPVPTNITAINDLPALDLYRGEFGALQARGLLPAPDYKMSFGGIAHLNLPPTDTDRHVPAALAPVLAEVLAQQAPIATGANDPRKVLEGVFRDFRYSLQPEDGGALPLQHFLLNRQAGHCEYFASASVLLLRQMGIPARYAVGYAVQEYSPMLGMYLVRERHAHAWALAFLDNQWQVVDTTPAIWAANEADAASFAQPLFDLVANGLFLFRNWWNAQRIEDYEEMLYLLGGLLSLFLVWRISRSEQVHISQAPPTNTTIAVAGQDSAFFQAIAVLRQQGFERGPGELPATWLTRIGQQALLPALMLHNRWRFDPQGISAAEQQQLRALVEAWEAQQLPANTTTDDPPGPPA